MYLLNTLLLKSITFNPKAIKGLLHKKIQNFTLFLMFCNLSFFFLSVPAYYALILRSLTVLEGLALYADPNFKVLAASYPYFAKRLLTDPNPYLRDALIELLFKDGKFRYIHQ